MERCTYCEAPDPGTRDHVPPKCLFPVDRRDNLITVPCCESCRKGTGLDDEYFRDMLVMRADLAGHPAVKKLLPKVLRSLRKPEQEAYAKRLAETARLIDVETEGGLYLGKAGTYNVDLSRLARVVQRTVRGLYWEETEGNRLPPETTVEVRAISEFRDMDLEGAASLDRLVEMAKVQGHGRKIGDDVFRYQLGFTENRRNTVWLLTFFGQIHFLGVALHPDDAEGYAA